MSNSQKSSSDPVEVVLGEPFAMEYQEDVLKTRRNLLIAGASAILIYFGNLQFGGGSPDNSISPFFGLGLKGMTHTTFLWCLFAAISYLLVHFLWASADSLAEYRLRSTGARVHFMTGPTWGNELVDTPIHPRQSTLYTWWFGSSNSFAHLPDSLQRTEKSLEEMVSSLEVLKNKHDDPASQNLNNALQKISEAQEAMTRLKNGFADAKKVLESQRIPTSLARFDRAFGRRALSQNLRWLLLEFGFPVVIGLLGAALTLFALHPNWSQFFLIIYQNVSSLQGWSVAS